MIKVYNLAAKIVTNKICPDSADIRFYIEEGRRQDVLFKIAINEDTKISDIIKFLKENLIKDWHASYYLSLHKIYYNEIRCEDFFESLLEYYRYDRDTFSTNSKWYYNKESLNYEFPLKPIHLLA